MAYIIIYYYYIYFFCFYFFVQMLELFFHFDITEYFMLNVDQKMTMNYIWIPVCNTSKYGKSLGVWVLSEGTVWCIGGPVLPYVFNNVRCAWLIINDVTQLMCWNKFSSLPCFLRVHRTLPVWCYTPWWVEHTDALIGADSHIDTHKHMHICTHTNPGTCLHTNT
jgi:hypothetical protein